MDSDYATASSSHEEDASDNAESKFDIWGAWKECERMLIANNYMLESQSLKMSPKIVQIANEMYTRITSMFDEMELIEDEELLLQDEDISDDVSKYIYFLILKRLVVNVKMLQN